ncbi:flocculation protein FLO11-like isoform X2 [Stylophora pistillata]|uniref:flocculation protein FLO11-like isoform X2 n=1 Tax=Stylophora pistillata TaxID=50429 RepID=UPI000C057BE8|nr:flocculation protein FLO11-like isoform X2 [Stylophora pistillata]
MSSCDNFVEQLWRKGKCANCFQSRDKHQNAVNKHEDATFTGSGTANCKPKRVVIPPQSPKNQNFEACSVENTDNLFKQERGKEGIDKGNGEKSINKSITPCTIHAIGASKDCSSTVTDFSKKAQDFKSSTVLKPRPVPRPKPRPASRAVEFSCGAVSRDENPQESADVLNGLTSFENSLGNSHAQPCNATSSEIPFESGSSILDHGEKSELENRSDTETNSETIENEVGAVELGEPKNDAEFSNVNKSDLLTLPANISIDCSTETEAADPLSTNAIENDDSSDEYVPMKSNIDLFGVESDPLHEVVRETDVLKPNCESDSDSKQMAISENRMKVACGSQIDEQSSSCVLEFRNPLCMITNKISDTRTTDLDTGESDKMNNNHDNPKKIICKSSSITEPNYVNRPSSSSSESAVSSSQDSGYENTRKSNRGNSLNNASGNGSVLVEQEVGLADISVTITPTTSDGYCVIESSGTSSSSWGSSTWDSCSTSDFHENSGEAVAAKNSLGNLNTRNDKPHLVASPKVAVNGQSIAKEKLQSSKTGPFYVNTTLKPFTKPYKVVDISAGVAVPTTETQNDAPPLPPKEKDLKKDRAEELNHIYLEPSEEVATSPEQALKNEKDKKPISKASASLNSSLSKASGSAMDKSSAVRRAPAPRPRSRIPSQFGTLPKPAPRTSRILNDTVVKVDSKEQKVVTMTPPVASSPPPPKSPLPQPVTPVKSASPSTSQTKSQQVSSPGPSPSHQESPPVSSPSPSPSQSKSQSKSKATRSSSFTGPHDADTDTSPAKLSSPKSTIRRAFASMKKLGGKKKHRHSKTIEISAPIAVNDEVPGFLEQKEAVRRRTFSEVKPLQTEKSRLLEPNEIQSVEPFTSSPDSVLSPATAEYASSATPPSAVESSAVEEKYNKKGSPIMQTKPGIGYQNFPLSKGGDTLERPKKPPRVAKVVKPWQHNEPTPDKGTNQHEEEPTYLQPNEDEFTIKVETALANLTDAEILAEALSRVEQELLGPLPAIPRSRQVHFPSEHSDGSTTSAVGKPDLTKRPVRVVSPTLVNGSGDKGDSKSRPRLPSRPPNTKPAEQPMRERSQSLRTQVLDRQKPPALRMRSQSMTTNVLEKRYNKILKLQLQTLEEVIHSWRRELLPDPELNLSDTRWSDYELCGDALSVQCPGAVLLPVKCAVYWEGNKKLLAKVEYPLHSRTRSSEPSPNQQDMRVCEALPYHVNISRVLTHFIDHVPGDAIGQPDCDSYETLVSITDQIPCETVADFLSRTIDEHKTDPETYEKKICLLILQLLSALNHLHKDAVVHRDLKAENLYILEGELVVITNFQCALKQPRSTQPNPFISSKSTSSHFGGNPEHLPPEIVNAPKDSEQLNYEDCDTFAAGCLIYEFLHRHNPFAANPSLVKQSYDQTDLPPVPFNSRYSRGLGAIARQLLQRHPQERLSAMEAIEMLPVLLWGPKDLDDDSIDNAIGDWLETERAHTVAMIARNQIQQSCSSDDFMETYMKCQFLVDASVETISHIYQQLDLDQ